MQRILNYFSTFGNRMLAGLGNAKNMLQNKEIFTVLAIILVAFGGFGLGRLSKMNDSKEPVTIEEADYKEQGTSIKTQESRNENTISQTATAAAVEQGKYVASKNGTKYYLPWCSGAGRISEANKIWFNTKEEAEARGLTPASNCPGI